MSKRKRGRYHKFHAGFEPEPWISDSDSGDNIDLATNVFQRGVNCDSNDNNFPDAVNLPDEDDQGDVQIEDEDDQGDVQIEDDVLNEAAPAQLRMDQDGDDDEEYFDAEEHFEPVDGAESQDDLVDTEHDDDTGEIEFLGPFENAEELLEAADYDESLEEDDGSFVGLDDVDDVEDEEHLEALYDHELLEPAVDDGPLQEHEDEDEDDDDVGADDLQDYQSILEKMSKEWLEIEMTHRVSKVASEAFWNSGKAWFHRLFTVKQAQKVKKKTPSFVHIRRKMFKDYVPPISIDAAYQHKESGETTIIEGSSITPRSRFPPHEYHRLWEISHVKVHNFLIFLCLRSSLFLLRSVRQKKKSTLN